MIYALNVEDWIAKHIEMRFKKVKYGRFSIEILREILDCEEPTTLIVGPYYHGSFSQVGEMLDGIYIILKNSDIKNIIALSTYNVYKPKYEIPYCEVDPLEPMNSLGVRALILEKYLEYLSKRVENVEFVILRMFNVYGPFQTPDYVIPGIINSVLKSTEISIGDRKKVRDFLYIDDFLDLLEILITRKASKSSLKIYNVGSGEGISVEKLVQKIEEVMNKQAKIVFDPSKIRYEYDYDYAVANIESLSKELGWKPKVKLEEGLKLMINWMMGRSLNV